MNEVEVLGRAYNILLVDDNPDHLMILERFLKDLPCNIHMADNGLSAIEKALATKYDLILMDMKMPDMDGCTATKKIREWENANGLLETPIFIISAYAFKEDIEKGMDEGCTIYLVKPLRKSTLIEAIMEAIPLFRSKY